MEKYNTLLLIGPTGSGKTPLGEYLALNGYKGTKCRHFDFGANLRQIAGTGQPSPLISDEDIKYIKKVLTEGALLENDTFHIAQNILRTFARQNGSSAQTLIVLNGLPRHTGQAADLATLVKMHGIINLDCPAEVVYQRIRRNTGGDRAIRTDDSLTEIKKKLDIFRQRTIPLLDYYQSRGVPVTNIPVTPVQVPADIIPLLMDPLVF